MNRRDIKNKNKISDTAEGADNELQPLQGFSEAFNSNGLNNKFGEWKRFPVKPCRDLERPVADIAFRLT